MRMRKTMRVVLVLMCLHPWVSPGIDVGYSMDEVSQALGPPKSMVTLGEKIVLTYPSGIVEFKQGKVVLVRLKSSPEERTQSSEGARLLDQGTTNAPAPAAYAGPADARTREITRLTNQLSKGQVNARREAAEKLESLADPRTWDVLVKALEDTDGGVQCKALERVVSH